MEVIATGALVLGLLFLIGYSYYFVMWRIEKRTVHHRLMWSCAMGSMGVLGSIILLYFLDLFDPFLTTYTIIALAIFSFACYAAHSAVLWFHNALQQMVPERQDHDPADM